MSRKTFSWQRNLIENKEMFRKSNQTKMEPLTVPPTDEMHRLTFLAQASF